MDQATGRAARSTDAGAGISGKGYVPEVDALRAVGMLMVVGIHCNIMPFGWMGVWLFYVVSGFAVTNSILHIAEARPRGPSFLQEFWRRRVLRIFPVYFIYVGLNAVFFLLFFGTMFLDQLPLLVLFMQNFQMAFWTGPPTPPIWYGYFHLWTLSTEQQFYLVFSLLFAFMPRQRFIVVLWGMLIVAPFVRWAMGAIAMDYGMSPRNTAFLIYVLAPGHLDSFAAGALLAVHRQYVAARPAVTKLATLAFLGVTTLHIAVYAVLGSVQAGGWSPEAFRNILSGILIGQGREISVYWIPMLAGVAFVAGCLSRRSIWVRAARFPGLMPLGRISYSGYLWHVPVMWGVLYLWPDLMGSLQERLILFLLVTAGTVVVAGASFALIEQRTISQRSRSAMFARATI